MSVFAQDDLIRQAVVGATSRKQVLQNLGLTPASSNYDRLDKAAGRLGLVLPRLGKHGKPRDASGAFADHDRLRSLVSDGLDLNEILGAVGLAQAPVNRYRLGQVLATLGLVATRKSTLGYAEASSNLARMTGLDPLLLSSAAAHPNASGDASELAVAACLRRLGATVSFPIGYACRYDLVADIVGRLFCVQVKTGMFRNGCVVANGISSKSPVPYTVKEVDALAVYCPAFGSVYWVPSAEVIKEIRLRVTETSNGQQQGTKPAYRYYIGQV
jgi:hypothetical protein